VDYHLYCCKSELKDCSRSQECHRSCTLKSGNTSKTVQDRYMADVIPLTGSRCALSIGTIAGDFNVCNPVIVKLQHMLLTKISITTNSYRVLRHWMYFRGQSRSFKVK